VGIDVVKWHLMPSYRLVEPLADEIVGGIVCDSNYA
jgi:hypothetical protein